MGRVGATWCTGALPARGLLLAVLVAGCGGDGDRAAGTGVAERPAGAATPAPTPSPAPAGRPVRFAATDGVRLRGTLVRGTGSAAPAVILVHQANGGPDEFDDVVPYLHAAGHAVLTYGSREDGRLDEAENARDIAGAVRALRDQPGVDPDRLAVVGASIGASAAAYLGFTAAGRRLRATVGVSPAVFLGPPPRDREPQDVLLIADRTERPAADLIADGAPGIAVETAPVLGHGVELLGEPRVRDRVLEFLAARLVPGAA